MARLAITLEGSCASEGHLRIGVAINDGPKHIYDMTVDQVRGKFLESDREITLSAILRLFAAGKTLQQIRTGILGGIQVDIP